jgi:hypothetical protein
MAYPHFLLYKHPTLMKGCLIGSVTAKLGPSGSLIASIGAPLSPLKSVIEGPTALSQEPSGGRLRPTGS